LGLSYNQKREGRQQQCDRVIKINKGEFEAGKPKLDIIYLNQRRRGNG
jgi:hypothetical protein